MSSSTWLSFLTSPWRKSSDVSVKPKPIEILPPVNEPEKIPDAEKLVSSPSAGTSRSCQNNQDGIYNQSIHTPEGLRPRDLNQMRKRLGLPSQESECLPSRHCRDQMYAKIEKRYNRSVTLEAVPSKCTNKEFDLFSPSSEEMLNYYSREYYDERLEQNDEKSPALAPASSSENKEPSKSHVLNSIYCSPIRDKGNQAPLTATAAIVASSSHKKPAKMNTSELSSLNHTENRLNMSWQSLDSPTYRYAWKKLEGEDRADNGVDNSFSSRNLLRSEIENSDIKGYNFEDISGNKCKDDCSPSGTSQSSNMLSISTLTSQTYETISGYGNGGPSKHSNPMLDKSKETTDLKFEEPDDLLLKRKSQNQRNVKRNIIAGLVARFQSDVTLCETQVYKKCIENNVSQNNLIDGYPDNQRNEVLSKIGTAFYSRSIEKLTKIEKHSMKFLSSLLSTALPKRDNDKNEYVLLLYQNASYVHFT